MEASKAGWDTLFEPYPFFESYKNYLQIDITAENADDLRQWKGWVESRLRQLTLKVCTVKLKGLHTTVCCVFPIHIQLIWLFFKLVD